MRIWKILGICAATIIILITSLILLALPNLGGEHDETDKIRYAKSTQYDQAQSRFVSPKQTSIDRLKDRVFDVKTIVQQLRSGTDFKPEEKLPEHRIDLAAFQNDKTGPNIIWLGHSSFLIRISGKTLLIDPVFENAGPIFFLGQRFQQSVLARNDLPPIDYVLISHDHYDHLEAATTKYLAETQTRFIVPMGVGAHLREWGIPEERFSEKDWWDEIRIDDLLIALVPSEHYSGRTGFLANDTLWTSYVIRSPDTSIYFSGDSGYGQHFAEIGKRYGPFDLAFLENGQYSPISREIHMHPEDIIQAFKDLNAKAFLPIHWAMFSLARHSWYEPAQRITELARQNNLTLYIPKIGEMITRTTKFELDQWWLPIMKRQIQAK